MTLALDSVRTGNMSINQVRLDLSLHTVSTFLTNK